MKRLLSLFAVLSLAALFLAPGVVRAQDDSDQDVSFQTFYDQLGNDGTWIQTDDYGYVFQPNVSDPNWQPYTDGHWVYTEDGWTWVSDEPWGWATYHYGRWADLDNVGWVWVPGYEWAPAWVSWRYGGGYAGWAPLPPDEGYGHGHGWRHFGGNVDATFHLGAGNYNFVRTDQLGEGNMHGVIMDRGNNSQFYGHTKNITNISHNKAGGRGSFGGVKAGGPPIAAVNAHATNKVPTMKLTNAAAPGRATAQGNSLAIYAPKVNAATAKQAKPATVSRTVSHPTMVNHGATGAASHANVAKPNGGPAPEAANTGEPAHAANNEPEHKEASAPKTESAPAANHPEEHQAVEKPAAISHPEGNGGASHEEKKSSQNHPQGGGGAPHPENKPAPKPHPSAPKPQEHPKPSGGGNKPSGKDDKDKKPGQ